MLRLEQKETYGTHIHTGNSEPSSVLGCDGNGDILFVPLGLFQRMTRRGCKEDYFPCPPFIPFFFSRGVWEVCFTTRTTRTYIE